jgi:hypothetical protein
MTGLTNYSADNLLNYVTGQIAMPSLPAVYLALFTAVGTDAGTGFTEVSGGAYARVQVAGTAITNATTSTASPTISTAGAGVGAWIVAGMSVYDATNGNAIGTVLSTSGGNTITLTANSLHAIGSGDTLNISAFGNGSGTGPSTNTNGSIVTFAQATASWGTVIAWGLYDALTSGNLLGWDFLGNFAWLPFEIPTASNLATVKANGYVSNDPVVFTAEYGGTLPTLSTGTFTSYTVNFVATPATDTINVDTTSGPATPVVTTSSGSGMVRKIVQQPIAQNVTASFAASTLTLSAA